MADQDFIARLSGNCLATVEVEYWKPKSIEAQDLTAALRKTLRESGLVSTALPDASVPHSGILNTFSWQTLDVVPRCPRIRTFLDFWKKELANIAPINRVRVGWNPLITPNEIKKIDAEYRHGLH